MIQIDLSCGCHYEYRHVVTDVPLGFHRIGFTPHGSPYERTMEVAIELVFPPIPQQFYRYVIAHLEMRQVIGFEEVIVKIERVDDKG